MRVSTGLSISGFPILPCGIRVNRRKPAVKYLFRTWLPLRLCARYLFFLLSPVVSGPAFAAYCHLPTVFLSG